MKILRSPAQARKFCARADGPIVLVPTMGALHRGHLKLVKRGRALAGRNGTLMVSIFVNPAQFGPKEDFSAYPRPFRRDCGLCDEAGADAVFAPGAGQMYPPDASVRVAESVLSRGLCGASRPGHFDGVCTVVAKLFNILRPDIAVFGQKDWQQLAVIRRMTRDLDFPVRIVGVPTVREPDGLALSSRNAYLSASQRRAAPAIYAALKDTAQRIAGGVVSVAALRSRLLGKLQMTPEVRVEYAEIVSRDTLEPLTKIDRPVTIAVAVRMGRARLIDNIQARPGRRS